MADLEFLSGVKFTVYSGAVGAMATTITATDGTISPDASVWTELGGGKYDDGVTFENMDERTQLRFQGSKGRPSAKRRTESGLMITLSVFEATPQFAELSWGNAPTTTAAAANQVGVYKQNFDLPLAVPEYAVQAVIDSPFDVDDDESWKGLIYIPKATFKIGPFNLATDPEATSLEIRQLDYTSPAYWETVFANAT